MFYKCSDCSAVTEWDKLRRVPVGRSVFWGVSRTEYADVCPRCGSEDIREYKGGGEDDEYNGGYYHGNAASDHYRALADR